MSTGMKQFILSCLTFTALVIFPVLFWTGVASLIF